MEAIIATCGDSEIRIQEYNIFKYNSWLTSSCISFYTEYIKQSTPADRLFIFDTFTIQWYLIEDLDEITGPIMTLHLEKFDVICVPINDSPNIKLPGTGSHWSLLLYIKESNRFVLVDSSYSSFSKNALDIITIFSKLVFKEHPKSEVYPHSSKQDNSYDCGMYVVHNIELISLWLKSHATLDLSTLSSIAPQEIKTARSKMVSYIDSIKKHKECLFLYYFLNCCLHFIKRETAVMRYHYLQLVWELPQDGCRHHIVFGTSH